jgi:hypothetical protein
MSILADHSVNIALSKFVSCQRAWHCYLTSEEIQIMASKKQRAAAQKNIKKAAAAAKRKRTIAHLPKKTRTALGKQATKVAREKRAA